MDLITIGSYVAFGLAALKVIEFFRDRKPKISLQTLLRGSSDVGNDLLLLNSSKVPTSVYYYELVWVRHGFFSKHFGIGRKVVAHEFSLEDATCDITVDGYSLATLTFSDQDHFKWGGDVANDLYIKLSLVGRKRPLWLWVT